MKRSPRVEFGAVLLSLVVGSGCGDDSGSDDVVDASTVGQSSSPGDGDTSSQGRADDSGPQGSSGGADGDSGSATEGDSGTGAAGDSGSGAEGGAEDGPCFVDCASELELLLPMGTADFTLSLTAGVPFGATISCPSGLVEGWFMTPGTSAQCDAGFVSVSTMGYTFGETLTVVLDSGAPEEITPEYTWIESCGMDACNLATVMVSAGMH